MPEETIKQTSKAFPAILHPRDKVMVMVDGANFFATLRTLRLKIDYEAMHNYFKANSRFVRPMFFSVLKEANSREAADHATAEGFYKLLDFLEYQGFTIVTREVYESVNGAGHVTFRGTIIPEMIVEMITAADNGVDHIILLSGDGELAAGVREVKRRGTKVTVVSSEQTKVISQALRRECDEFIELARFPTNLPDSFISPAA